MIKTYPMASSAILRLNYIRDKIDFSPPYQRNSDIWNVEKRQLLVDSILNNFDVPKIYFHALTKPRRLSTGKDAIYAVIDGKQRMQTIFYFLDDKFPLADEFVLYDNPSIKAAGLKYSGMAEKYPELKVSFDSFVLPIMLVETEDIDLIEEMFSRLNEAVPLSSAEKRNAFGGPIPKVIREVADHQFFSTKVKFSNKRYQHREVAVRLLFLESTMQLQSKVIDTKKVFLDAFVKEYKRDDGKTRVPPKDLGTATKRILNIMLNTFRNKDALLRSQAAVPIHYLLFRHAIERQCTQKISRTKLEEFSRKVASNRKLAEADITLADFDLLEFDRMSIQDTNDASSIKERLRIICKFLDLPQPQFQ